MPFSPTNLSAYGWPPSQPTFTLPLVTCAPLRPWGLRRTHTGLDPLLLDTFDSSFFACKHILTTQAHLASRMSLMNADLLAAVTGGLLVLMTGALLSSRDENRGKDAEQRQPLLLRGNSIHPAGVMCVCVYEWPKGVGHPEVLGVRRGCHSASAPMCQVWLPPKIAERSEQFPPVRSGSGSHFPYISVSEGWGEECRAWSL